MSDNVVTGILKANGCFVGELTCDFTGTKPPITANYALAYVTENGVETLYGKAVKVDGWSEETLLRARELLASIQRDLSSELFDEGAVQTQTGQSSNLPIGEDGIPGL